MSFKTVFIIFLLTVFNISVFSSDSLNYYILKTETSYNEKSDDFGEIAVKTLEMALNSNQFLLSGKIEYLMGEYNYENNQFLEAVVHFISANKVIENSDSVLLHTKLLSRLGAAYIMLEKYDKAHEVLQQALKLSKSILNEELIARNLENLGMVYSSLNEFNTSKTFYDEALKMHELNMDSAKIASLYLNKGINYSRHYRFNEAIQSYNYALNYYESIEDHERKATVINNLGLVYHQKNEYTKALRYFEKALIEMGKLNLEKKISNCLINIGNVYYDLEDFNKAKEYYENSLELSHQIGLIDNLQMTYEKLSLIEYELNNYKAAYNHHHYFKRYYDSVFNQNKLLQIEELKAKYESDVKEEEINNLKFQNQIEQAKKKKAIANLIFAFIIGFIIILVMLWLYKIKTKHNKKLKEEIAERRKVEYELKELTEKLEERIKDRTRELEIAKDKAVQSEKLKTYFLANMSHEVRTPMNGIMGFSELLSNDTLSKEKRTKYIELIHKNTKVLLNLIEDIIDVSRIEAGQLTFNKSVFKINDLLNELYNYLKAEKTKYKKNDIELVLEKPDNTSHIKFFTDPARIQQAFTYVLNNAIKFTFKGKIAFGYRLLDDQVEFFVQDTGIGISKNNQKIIFERFRQVEESMTRNFGGTGLGLFLTKNIVELMGGTIDVDSKEGEGATIYFRFPTKEIIIDEKESSFNNLEKFKNRKILIAEDNEINYGIMNHILSKQQLIVYWAKNGKEAVNMVSNRNYDFIFMDIQMPVMNGIEAIKEIRKFNSDIPIMVLTAYGMNQNKKDCYEAGCNDFLTKPVNQKELFEKLSKYL